MAMMGLVLLVFSQHVVAYTLSYYDCTKPARMNEFDIRTYCTSEKPTLGETMSYHVLQKRKNIKMTGYSCSMVRSTFIIHCGMFSHQELLQMPDIEIKQDIPLQQCQSMVTTGYWTTREGTRHRIKIGEESITHVSEKGVLHEDSNKIWCEGEELKINGNIISGVVKMVQYRTKIEEESYLINQKRIEVISSHVKLPSTCTLEKGGCLGERTYTWNPPATQCPLVKINTGKFNKEGNWLLEHRAKLLFKITDTSPSPTGCPAGNIFHTEYEDLYLTQEGQFPHIDESIEIGLYVKQSSDYVMYETERLTSNLAESTQSHLCKQLYQRSKDELIEMSGGRFGRRNGDVLYTFACVQKTGKVMGSNKCYDRIPLKNNIFIDPITRIGTKHATIKECNKVFPEAIKTNEGWIAMPGLSPIKDPSQFEGSTNNLTHEDMSRGGLYTNEEINEWEQFITYGTFRESLLNSISTGACVHRDICKTDNQLGLPSYNIDRLMEEVEDEMNPFSKLKAWIEKYGAYLSALIILVWTGKCMLWIALLFNTIVREGKNVAVALVYRTCCGALYKSGRIRRHNNKKAASAPPAEELRTGLLGPV